MSNLDGLRKYAFEKASQHHTWVHDEMPKMDDIIEDAIKIEAYLKGDLDGPDM